MEDRKSGRKEGRKNSLCRPLPFTLYPFLLVLVFSLTTLGCDADAPSEPGLTDSLMVEVLVGVHLADARAARTGDSRDSLRAAALAAFGTDTLAFHHALDYYAHHPDAYQPLYDRALDRLLDERRNAVE